MNNTSSSNTSKNLVDTATAQGSFKTFARALSAAGLNETLRGHGPYTVFAPTDAAFEKLPSGKLENWLKPENKAELVSVLNYHVAPGRVLAADVREDQDERRKSHDQRRQCHADGYHIEQRRDSCDRHRARADQALTAPSKFH
jgi:uncharacterized surface protein with fasciclin (FAS1) repeats